MKIQLLWICLTFSLFSCVSNKSTVQHSEICYSKKTNTKPKKQKKEKKITRRSNKKFTREFLKNLDKYLTAEEIDVINNTNFKVEFPKK